MSDKILGIEPPMLANVRDAYDKSAGERARRVRRDAIKQALAELDTDVDADAYLERLGGYTIGQLYIVTIDGEPAIELHPLQITSKETKAGFALTIVQDYRLLAKRNQRA